MNEKDFLTKLFWLALAIFVLFYSLIALVDPYQQFGFNQFNRDSMPVERIEKAQLLEKNNNEYELKDKNKFVGHRGLSLIHI